MNHCLQVLLGHDDVLREMKNNAYANIWGVKEVYYGICASSELVNRDFKIVDNGRLRRLDAYTGDLGRVR